MTPRPNRSLLPSFYGHLCIAHTGDFLHGWKQRSGVNIEQCHNAINLLQSYAELTPTFISIGNHESHLSGNDIVIIHSADVTLLDNCYVAQDIGGHRLIIGGLSSGYYNRAPAEENTRLGIVLQNKEAL